MKIIQEREKCIGCGSCIAVCPKYWQLEDDGKARLVGSTLDPKTGNHSLEVDKASCNQEAADVCPVEIIKVIK